MEASYRHYHLSEESDMVKNTKKTNPELVCLIGRLKEKSRSDGKPIWRDIAKRLERPSRVWTSVNVSKIDRYADNKETIIVPGKVLGSGILSKKLTIAAWKFSESAINKIENTGGKALSLEELMNDKKLKNIKIIG